MKGKFFRYSPVIISLCILTSCISLKKIQPSLPFDSGKNGDLDYLIQVVPGRHLWFKKYPLIIFLHGAEQEAESVMHLWSKDARTHGVMLVAPRWARVSKDLSGQHKDESGVLNLVRMLQERYPIDNERTFIAGISAGGFKAQRLIEENPDLWKGAILMSYGPPLGWFKNVEKAKIPDLYFLCGEDDGSFSAQDLIDGVSLLRAKGISARVYIDPGPGHEYKTGWSKTVFDWVENGN